MLPKNSTQLQMTARQRNTNGEMQELLEKSELLFFLKQRASVKDQRKAAECDNRLSHRHSMAFVTS